MNIGRDMVSPSPLPNQSFHRCKAIITLFVRGGREALYCDHRIFTVIHSEQINGNFTPHTCVLLFVTNIVLHCVSFRDRQFYMCFMACRKYTPHHLAALANQFTQLTKIFESVFIASCFHFLLDNNELDTSATFTSLVFR